MRGFLWMSHVSWDAPVTQQRITFAVCVNQVTSSRRKIRDLLCSSVRWDAEWRVFLCKQHIHIDITSAHLVNRAKKLSIVKLYIKHDPRSFVLKALPSRLSSLFFFQQGQITILLYLYSVLVCLHYDILKCQSSLELAGYSSRRITHNNT